MNFMDQIEITPIPGKGTNLEKGKVRYCLQLDGVKLTYLIVDPKNILRVDTNDIDIRNYNVIVLNNNNTMRNFKFPSKQKERT